MSATPSPRPGLRPLEDALADLLNDTAALAGVQQVPTFEADGRVLALNLASALDVPGHDNTSMDGYAVRVADLAQAAGAPLVGSQRIPAGHHGIEGTAVFFPEQSKGAQPVPDFLQPFGAEFDPRVVAPDEFRQLVHDGRG